MGGEVGQVDEAYVGFLIPGEHGVNGFCQLRTAFLVDTARINPGIAKSPCPCQATSVLDLLKSLLLETVTLSPGRSCPEK